MHTHIKFRVSERPERPSQHSIASTGNGNRVPGRADNVSSSALRQKGAQLAVTCAAKVKFVQFFVISFFLLFPSLLYFFHLFAFVTLLWRLCANDYTMIMNMHEAGGGGGVGGGDGITSSTTSGIGRNFAHYLEIYELNDEVQRRVLRAWMIAVTNARINESTNECRSEYGNGNSCHCHFAWMERVNVNVDTCWLKKERETTNITHTHRSTDWIMSALITCKFVRHSFRLGEGRGGAVAAQFQDA